MKNAILILAGFMLYHIGSEYFEPIMLYLNKVIHYKLLSYFLTYILIGIPVFITICIVNKELNFFRILGLQSNILKGLLVGMIFSLPMFIGSAIQSNIAKNMSVPDLIARTMFAGLFEEIYFRGFFFGQLFRKTQLGFLPSIFFCSIIFASGHLYQSQDAGVLFGIFITTFMGSVFFAWLYVEWNYNLWVPIFLHTLMNLSWYIFTVSDNALGTVNSNLFRILTIALSIILTVLYKKKIGAQLLINKRTLLMKMPLGNDKIAHI